MPEPIEITTHSADSIRRLIDWLQGKPKTEALLRSISSARVDISDVIDGFPALLTVDDCQVSVIPTVGDTPSDVADDFVDLINNAAESGASNLESFEEFAIGAFVGEGVQGSWIADTFGAPVTALSVNADSSRSGAQSIKTDLGANGIPPTVSPTAMQGGTLLSYTGAGDAVQNFEVWFRLPIGWPNTVDPNLHFSIPSIIIGGAGTLLDFEVRHVAGSGLVEINTFIVGGASGPSSPTFALGLIADGNWHKFSGSFDLAGTFITADIDDGVIASASGAGVIPIAAGGASIAAVISNLGVTTIFGVEDAFFDDFVVGTPTPCGEYDFENYIPTATEDLESFALAAPFDGVSGAITWEGDNLLGSVPFISAMIVTNAQAKSGTKSARTDFGAGLAPSLDPFIDVYHNALALAFPGSEVPLKTTEFSFYIPVGFGAALLAAGATSFFPITSLYIDSGTFDLAFFVLGYDTNADPTFANLGFAIWIPNEDASFPTVFQTIPEASLAGGWHTIKATIFEGVAKMEIDSGAAQTERTVVASFGNVWAGQMCVAPLGGIPIAIPAATLPEIYFDDFIIGGIFSRVFPVKALKNDPDDEYFYIQRTITPGLALSVTTSQLDRFRINRIGVVDQIQELETTLVAVMTGRGIDEAEGVQLDGIGTVVGLARTVGQGDDDYRVLLRIKILANLSAGEPERLIEIVLAWTASTFAKLSESFPGYVEIRFDGTVINASDLLDAADNAAAGGVRLDLFQLPPAPVFTFDGIAGTGFDEGKFADIVTP